MPDAIFRTKRSFPRRSSKRSSNFERVIDNVMRAAKFASSYGDE